MKKLCYLCLVFIAITLTACSNKNKNSEIVKTDDIVILYTANVECGGDEGVTYAGISAAKKEMQKSHKYVTLVDAGNYLSGELLGTISNGSYAADTMSEAGYDIASLGKKDFYYPVYRLNSLKTSMKFQLVSCNFIDNNTKESVYNSYIIKDYGDRKVAFIGITNPLAYNLRTESQYKDDAGNDLYSFCQEESGKMLYERVQKTVDAAKGEGADLVIALSNLGDDTDNKQFSVRELIANTSGISAVIDADTTLSIEQENVKNAEGKNIILTMPGSHLQQFGKMIISGDKITTQLVSDYKKKDKETNDFMVNELYKCQQNAQKTVVKTDFSLTFKDKNSKYLVRKQETNLGDLCADACREEMHADIALIEAGSIHDDVTDGSFTYGDVETIFPYNQNVCLIKATGKQILDALELGASDCPYENTNFLQVSGLKYNIDSKKPTAVLCEQGVLAYVSEEYRVNNVLVLNKESGQYEPLDYTKEYLVAISEYMHNGSEGNFLMFKDCEAVLDGDLTNQQTLLKYIMRFYETSLPKEYENINGQGRITIE